NKKNIGYCYPAMTLLFNRSEPVINMILSGLTDSIGLYETPTEAQELTAQAWLKILGPHYHNKRFNQLSAGEQRIVMVVRALIKLPPLLILDEPTAGLDDENTDIFIQLINAIAALKKITIIYISHRHEVQVQPDKIIELIPSAQGSTAIIHE
ncbi:MAG: ATP-binding cassette domain-containing protein, partial [Flavihumibacter sp.]|nr:ATP-binding cassette domain-containing protein [Flavihumibacter sp.]